MDAKTARRLNIERNLELGCETFRDDDVSWLLGQLEALERKKDFWRPFIVACLLSLIWSNLQTRWEHRSQARNLRAIQLQLGMLDEQGQLKPNYRPELYP